MNNGKKTHITDSRYLKSKPTNFKYSDIDKDRKVLMNVVLCQVGEAKGHGVHIDNDFISDCTEYAVTNWGDVGLKCRFGHPNMSNDALGTQMGRFKNFYQDGTQLKADLHLFDSANLSPTMPKMATWLMSMALESPSDIMTSIVFKPQNYFQLNSDLEKVYDDSLWDREGKIFVQFGELYNCDIVEEGAATTSLFSAEVNSDKFAVIATQFLDENPNILDFVQKHPNKITEFLETYNLNKLPSTQTELNKVMEDNKTELSAMDRIKKALSILGTEPKEEALQIEETAPSKTEELETNFTSFQEETARHFAVLTETIAEQNKALSSVADQLDFIAKNTKSKGFKTIDAEFDETSAGEVIQKQYKSADQVLRERREAKKKK